MKSSRMRAKTDNAKTATNLLVAMTGKASAAKAAEGDEPVFAYIASLPQPQRGIAERVDGLAATRRIRRLASLKDVPIVVVSAHDTADFHAEALASGCNEYVTKPIDFGQLELLLKRLVPPY